MADGVLLLVDAFEGPMPQTRFVLQKALELHLKPVVVINKVDRAQARPHEVLDEVFQLFVELQATDEQLDFRGVYAAGRDGWAVGELEDERRDLAPLLDMIVKHVPPPQPRTGPLQMLVAAMDHSDYVGRIGIGRIERGELRSKDRVRLLKRDGSERETVVKQLYVFDNLGRREVEYVGCGDICAVVGLDDVDIGDTIADVDNPEPLPIIAVDEPTLTMNFMVNDSPSSARTASSSPAASCARACSANRSATWPCAWRTRPAPTPSRSAGAASCTWRSSWRPCGARATS